jgi:hypothetical protein
MDLENYHERLRTLYQRAGLGPELLDDYIRCRPWIAAERMAMHGNWHLFETLCVHFDQIGYLSEHGLTILDTYFHMIDTGIHGLPRPPAKTVQAIRFHRGPST